MKSDINKNNINRPQQALRDSAALVSCVTFFLGVAIPAMLVAFKLYSLAFSLGEGFVPLVHFLGLLGILLLALAIGGYIGLLIWLIASRFIFHFTRSEVFRFAHTGPHTRFDDWLVDLVYPSGCVKMFL
jgi:hypothetical protein